MSLEFFPHALVHVVLRTLPTFSLSSRLFAVLLLLFWCVGFVVGWPYLCLSFCYKSVRHLAGISPRQGS